MIFNWEYFSFVTLDDSFFYKVILRYVLIGKKLSVLRKNLLLTILFSGSPVHPRPDPRALRGLDEIG